MTHPQKTTPPTGVKASIPDKKKPQKTPPQKMLPQKKSQQVFSPKRGRPPNSSRHVPPFLVTPQVPDLFDSFYQAGKMNADQWAALTLIRKIAGKVGHTWGLNCRISSPLPHLGMPRGTYQAQKASPEAERQWRDFTHTLKPYYTRGAVHPYMVVIALGGDQGLKMTQDLLQDPVWGPWLRDHHDALILQTVAVITAVCLRIFKVPHTPRRPYHRKKKNVLSV